MTISEWAGASGSICIEDVNRDKEGIFSGGTQGISLYLGSNIIASIHYAIAYMACIWQVDILNEF